jgi:hypothetical protein
MNRRLFPTSVLLCAFGGYLRAAPIPVVDLSQDTARHVIIAQGHGRGLSRPSDDAADAGWQDDVLRVDAWPWRHGGPLKRSDDGGKTWSDLLPVPENWWKVKNCPAIYRLTDPQGVARLIVYAGQGPDGTMQQSVSTDEAKRGRRCRATASCA